MKISTRGRYALMALVDLTKNSHEGPVPLAEMGAREEISLVYLEQIFMKLRRAGIVTSSRGAGGGYLLAKDPHQVSAAEIMRAVGELAPITRCNAHEVKGCRGDGSQCATHKFWECLGHHIEAYLESVSLHSIAYGKKCQEIVVNFKEEGDHHVSLS